MNKEMIKKSITLNQLDKKMNWSKEAKSRIETKASYIQMLQELKDFKESQGLTNTEISKRTGISRPELSNIFKGKRNITLDTIDKIASSFNKSIIMKLV